MSNNVNKNGVRYLTVTAMLSAIAYVLMFIDFPIPFLIPSFIQMDISELPALVGSRQSAPDHSRAKSCWVHPLPPPEDSPKKGRQVAVSCETTSC